MKHRVILIGCGQMGTWHAEKAENMKDRMEYTAVVDVVRERAQAASDLLANHPPVFTDYHEALGLGDVVLQVLPHPDHATCTIDCLNTGLHVLGEKPLANTEAECRAMIEAARKNNKILMVGYCMRYNPLIKEMHRLIKEEVFGKCFQLSIWTEQLTTASFEGMGKKAYLGGGQLFSHGCHYIDLMLWMMGKPKRGTHFGTNLCTPWMEREGTSNVCLEFSNGALGYHFGTWGARGSRMGYAFQAHCEQGLIDLPFYESKLYFRCKDPKHIPGKSITSQETLLMDGNSAKSIVQEMNHFLDCVETGRQPETSPEESLESLRCIWKLYEAEDKGCLADLTDIADLSRG